MKKRVFRLILMVSTIFVVLVSITPIQATQQGPTDWTRVYGGSQQDGIKSILQTSEGDYILTGWSASGGAGVNDVLLVKIDTNGEVRWSQTYGGHDYDAAYSSLQLMDDSFILAGYTKSIGAGKTDFMLLKLDADYDAAWVKSYGGSDDDVCQKIIQTADGGYILIGDTRSGGAGGQDALLVKTDEEGTLQWMQTYGGSEWEYVYSAIQTNDGGFAIVGSTYSYSSGARDAWLVKIDSQYQQQWIWTYGGSKEDELSSIIQTEDGGYLVAGTTQSYGAGYYDGLLIKLKPNLQIDWVKTYGGAETEVIKDLIPTTDGGYALFGGTSSSGAGYYDYWIVKTDASGNLQRAETYGGANTDYLNTGIQSTDGGYALAGFTYSYGAGESDAWLVKTPSFITTTKKTGITFATLTQPVQTLSIATPVMSFTSDPKPISTALTYTKEPDSPLTFTDDPSAHIEFETTFETAITFTTGPETAFESATSTPVTSSMSETTPTSSVSTPPETTSESSQAPVTVTVTDTETESQPPQIPGFTPLPVLFALVVIAVLYRRRQF